MNQKPSPCLRDVTFKQLLASRRVKKREEERKGSGWGQTGSQTPCFQKSIDKRVIFFYPFFSCCVIGTQHEAVSTTCRTPESLRRPRPVWRQRAVSALHPSITAAPVWRSALISSNAGRWMPLDRRTALTKHVISSSANLIQGDDYVPPATETSVSRDKLWKQTSLGRLLSQQILG